MPSTPWLGPAPSTKAGATELGRPDVSATHAPPTFAATGTGELAALGHAAHPATEIAPATPVAVVMPPATPGVAATVTGRHPRFTAPVGLAAHTQTECVPGAAGTMPA